MNARTDPIVSVISPCFNQAQYVGEMIRSVRNQTMSSWELIVVDDGSTDESSAAILAAAEEDPRVRLECSENRGVAAARNWGAGCASAGSDYLLFLDADDVLEPSMLHGMTTCLQAEPRFGMAHCRITCIDAAGRSLPDTPGLLPRNAPKGWGIRELRDDEPETPFSAILALAGIIPSAVLLRRSVFARTAGWDEHFDQGFEDTDLFLRMALEAPVRFVAESLVRHRRHDSQSSAVPGRHEDQLRKLHQRWRESGRWPEPYASVVRDAWSFYDRQLVWARARATARVLAAQGHPVAALRFLGGAVRIVIGSLIRRPR